MNEYEKESLLRPPVEYYASANYAIVGVVAAMAPEVFMMLPSVALTLSLFMFGMSLRRFLQGRKITNYQNGLWKLPIYMLSSVGDEVNDNTSYSELGLTGVLQKPIIPSLLVSTVKKKLGQ